jgi:hypothetical protein
VSLLREDEAFSNIEYEEDDMADNAFYRSLFKGGASAHPATPTESVERMPVAAGTVSLVTSVHAAGTSSTRRSGRQLRSDRAALTPASVTSAEPAITDAARSETTATAPLDELELPQPPRATTAQAPTPPHSRQDQSSNKQSVIQLAADEEELAVSKFHDSSVEIKSEPHKKKERKVTASMKATDKAEVLTIGPALVTATSVPKRPRSATREHRRENTSVEPDGTQPLVATRRNNSDVDQLRTHDKLTPRLVMPQRQG